MSTNQKLFSAMGIAVLAAGVPLTAQAQALPETALPTIDYTASSDLITVDQEAWDTSNNPAMIDAIALNDQWTQPTGSASDLIDASTDTSYEVDALTYPNAVDSTELAQSRRRRRGSDRSNQSFIGVGADFTYFDNISVGVISKFSINDQVAVRPSAVFGDGNFAALVPVTYEFEPQSMNSRVQFKPYVGAGGAYTSIDTNGTNNSEFDLLLSAGVDVPVSEQFTLNAQANYVGIFSDTNNFGITVGVGYNVGNLFR